MQKGEGPLVRPNKVTVQKCHCEQQQKCSKCKSERFLRWYPQCLVECHGALALRTLRHMCSPLAGSLDPRRGLFYGPSVCSSWSPCSSGSAWGADGCSRCPSSAASANRSGSSTWSRPVAHQKQSLWPARGLQMKVAKWFKYRIFMVAFNVHYYAVHLKCSKLWSRV